MQIKNLEVDMIACFNKEKNYPIPLKMRITTSTGIKKYINIDRLVGQKMEKIAGNRMCIFRCEADSKTKNEVTPFEVKYDMETGKWFLYKV